MAVLAAVKGKVGKTLVKVADKGGNLIAKASGLTSAQLEKIEKLRENYLSEKPEFDEEGIKRLLGTYSIEAYEAYLPLISSLYHPMALNRDNDEMAVNNRIRYFEITKWVSDPTEDNVDKLTNMYQVLSEEDCNIALIYHRDKKRCKAYFAVVNNDYKDTPSIANAMEDRLVASVRGNFPGVEIKSRNVTGDGVGIIPELENIKSTVIAAVSNVSSEKSEKPEKFTSQSMEKLLDGIVPQTDNEAYTIVLLATPVKEQLERKTALSELYSRLAPYAQWQTGFTYTETTAEGSSATMGANLGGSAGKQIGQTNTTGTNSSTSSGENESNSETESTGTAESDTNTQSDSNSHSDGENYSESQSSGDSDTENKNSGWNAILYNRGSSEGTTHSENTSYSEGTNTVDTQSHTDSQAHTQTQSQNHSNTFQKGKQITDTIGKMASKANSVTNSLGINFGVNFARSSNVSVFLGKNDSLTQTFTNHSVKNTLELIEQQIKRIEASTALGMWDFSAYFLSDSPVVANNAAHMYLALTQGEKSYLSQSAVNMWVPNENNEQDIHNILDFLKLLQHPQFELNEEDVNEDENWLMYPPHVSTTVSLTGKELAYSLNLPKKSVSGLPVLESVAFGREVQRFTPLADSDDAIQIGKVFHMRKTEKAPVKLDINSLCSHTFITGSTGTGKSNMIYQILDKLVDEEKKFLVIEPAKGEYKNVLGGHYDAKVYGTNPRITELLKINPFSFPDSISVLEHIDRLTEIFNACWPMYAAMPAVLKDAIEKAYKDKGWVFSNYSYYSTDFPTFADLMKALPEVMENSLYSADTKSDYQGALITRVKSLTNGINGEIFCANDEIINRDLFDKNVIVDISRVGSTETKSLLMGILIMKLQEYRLHTGKMNAALQHVTVLEEAHNLLRKTTLAQSQESSNLQGKSVEMLTNAIAEMRTYGEGFIISDQAPDLLDDAVIRNTNTKLVFRLPDETDCERVGKSIALKPEQIRELAKLPAFVAAVYQNDWVEAVLCKSEKFDKEKPFSYQPDDTNLYIEEFFASIYTATEKVEFSEKKKAFLSGWIARLDVSYEVKQFLYEALDRKELDDFKKCHVAYNLFGGQKVAAILEDAADPTDGMKKAHSFIDDRYSLNNSDLSESIKKYIWFTINSNEKYAAISERYRLLESKRREF